MIIRVKAGAFSADITNWAPLHMACILWAIETPCTPLSQSIWIFDDFLNFSYGRFILHRKHCLLPLETLLADSSCDGDTEGILAGSDTT